MTPPPVDPLPFGDSTRGLLATAVNSARSGRHCSRLGLNRKVDPNLH